MSKAKNICINALENIRHQWLDDKIDISTMEVRSDKMIYNFLICEGYKNIAEEWYLNKQ